MVDLMELPSSKRIKPESEPNSSHEELVGSNLLHLDDSSGGSVMHLQDPDFETLRWTSTFVDKTMLIRAICKDRSHRILLTAPPKFGKTTAKNMLQMFFEIGDSEQKYKVFKDLKVSKCTEECTDNHDCESKKFFRRRCGQHPVISLDFAQLSAKSYGALLDTLRHVIEGQFKKYEFLIHKDGEKYSWASNDMGKVDIDGFLHYLEPEYWIKANDYQKELYILRGFRYLIEVLSAYYRTKQRHKKIIVLIDDFDAAFMKMVFDDYSDKRTLSLMRHLMRLLCKDEVSAEFIERVVIFSVTEVGGIGANNVNRRTFLDKNNPYNKFFGFTKEEVVALVKSTVMESQQQRALDEIALWYNHYTVEGDNHTTICNPVSITKYLQKLVRRSYWVDSVGTSLVCQLFKFEKIREKLFPVIRDDRTISINTRTIFLDSIDDLSLFSQSILDCVSVNQVDLALQFLAERGYFNVINKQDWYWTLRIPSQEVKVTLEDKLHEALLASKPNLFDVKQRESFVNALESLGCGPEHEPMKYVTFKKSVENLYTNRELPKAHFHFHCDLWMLIFGCVKKGCSPKLDLIIITKSGTGIVIEVKLHDRNSAKDGLERCLKKEYYKVCEGKVKNTILMGLHLSDIGRVSIRYLENFESRTLSDEQHRDTLIKAIVENSSECSDM